MFALTHRARRAISWRHYSQSHLPSPLAFVFDIDGVLLRGPTVLPAAKRAFQILEGDNPKGIKIPWVVMTNGGGVQESDRCARLSAQFGVQVHESQFIQSHSVLRPLVPQYVDRPILAVGGRGNRVREVAKAYGFNKVHTPLDLVAWNPDIWPFHKLTKEEQTFVEPVDFSKIPIHAVFVFHDSYNWSLDIQIMTDILRSQNRTFGAPFHPNLHFSPDAKLSKSEEGRTELAFCNPDLLWRSAYHLPRYGQGAFREAFQAVFKATTGYTYPYMQYGKPTEATYKYSETVVRDLMGIGRMSPLPKLYMVGDNPDADIAGANSRGAPWSSILVHTGVYDPALGLPPSHIPTKEAADVEEAVKWAVKREMGW